MLNTLVDFLLNFGEPDTVRQFIILTYTGISEGMLLALIALGLVLIFKATDVINFAHGEFMLLGAFLAFEILDQQTGEMTFSTFTILEVLVIYVVLNLLLEKRLIKYLPDNLQGKWSGRVALNLLLLAAAALIAAPLMQAQARYLIVGLIMVALFMMIAGIAVERLVLRRMIGEPVISVIMVTIGLSSMIDAFVGAYWGILPKRFSTDIFPENVTKIVSSEDSYRLAVEGARRPAILQYENLYTMLIVVALVVLFIVFFRKSKEGIAMRATADDQQAAMSMGISISRVFAVTWSIAALTAAAAGLMVGNLTQVSGDISGVSLRAFPVIILGGLDSIPGAILGGLIIGLTEQYVSGYLDPSYKGVVPYLVLIAILMVRPYGLFGQKRIERV